MKKLTIQVAADGSVRIEASGFAGASCQKATGEIERALGVVGVVNTRTKKAEYFTSQKQSEKVTQ